MSFEIAGKSTLLALSVSRSGGENGSVLLTVKAEVEGQSAAAAAAALGTESVADVERSFHMPELEDPDRNPRFLSIEGIAARAEWRGKHVLFLAGFKARPSKVNGVTLLPRPGGLWTVGVKLQVEEPTPGMIETLAEMLNEEGAVPLRLEADPELNLRGGGPFPSLRDGESVTISNEATGESVTFGKKEAA